MQDRRQYIVKWNHVRNEWDVIDTVTWQSVYSSSNPDTADKKASDLNARARRMDRR